MVVNRMKMGEKDKERIRACLIVNDVLSIADAQAKRFAMMNEVQPAPRALVLPAHPVSRCCAVPVRQGQGQRLSGLMQLGCGRVWAGGADMCVGRWR